MTQRADSSTGHPPAKSREKAARTGRAYERPRVLYREALETIAADESTHAELAWRTVKWALDTFGADVRETIRDEMARIQDELGGAYEMRRSAWDETLLDHGVITTNVRGSMRRAVLKDVVLPCLGALGTAQPPRSSVSKRLSTLCES